MQSYLLQPFMALSSLKCAVVPLRK